MSIVVQTAYETPLPERYQALLNVSQTLMSNRCSEELLGLLARELRKVVNFDFLSVGIYDEKAHEVRTKTFGESDAPIPVSKLAPEETLTWWVYRHQQPLVLPSLDTGDSISSGSRATQQPRDSVGMRSSLDDGKPPSRGPQYGQHRGRCLWRGGSQLSLARCQPSSAGGGRRVELQGV